MVKTYIHTIPPEQLTPRQRKDKKYREANREKRSAYQKEYYKRKKQKKNNLFKPNYIVKL